MEELDSILIWLEYVGMITTKVLWSKKMQVTLALTETGIPVRNVMICYMKGKL